MLKAGSASAMPVTNDYSALLSIRPSIMFKGKINRSATIPKSMNIFSHTTKVLSLSIVKNAVMTDGGTVWSDGLTGGSTQYNKDMVLATPADYSSLGILVYTSLISTNDHIDLSDTFNYLNEYLCINGDGLDSDVYTIIVRTVIASEIDDVTVGIGDSGSKA